MNRRRLLGTLACLPFIPLFENKKKLRDIYKVDSKGNIIAKIRMKHIKKNDIITMMEGNNTILNRSPALADAFYSSEYNGWVCKFER